MLNRLYQEQVYLPGPDSEVTHQKEKSLFRRADPRSNSRMSLASSWSMINSMRMLMALFLSIVYYKLTVHVPSAVRTCISHLVKIVGNSFSESLCSCCSQCFLDCSSPHILLSQCSSIYFQTITTSGFVSHLDQWHVFGDHGVPKLLGHQAQGTNPRIYINTRALFLAIE